MHAYVHTASSQREDPPLLGANQAAFNILREPTAASSRVPIARQSQSELFSRCRNLAKKLKSQLVQVTTKNSQIARLRKQVDALEALVQDFRGQAERLVSADDMALIQSARKVDQRMQEEGFGENADWLCSHINEDYQTTGLFLKVLAALRTCGIDQGLTFKRATHMLSSTWTSLRLLQAKSSSLQWLQLAKLSAFLPIFYLCSTRTCVLGALSKFAFRVSS